MIKSSINLDTLKRGEELFEIGKRAVAAAQEENRRLGVPNVYSIDGLIYYEMPNGELSREDPYPGKDSSESAQG